MMNFKKEDVLSEDFYLIPKKSLPLYQRDHLLTWDPWPVSHFKGGTDEIFQAASKVIEARNYQDIDNLMDRIALLPASSSPRFTHQGGSQGAWLYSMRSPSVLPFRIVLWMTPSRRIMVRQGARSTSLQKYISSWGGSFEGKDDGFCKRYRFWKCVKSPPEWLKDGPVQLQQQLHDRWWAVNGFPFFKLPPELRQMILGFALGPVIKPVKPKHKNKPKSLYWHLALTSKDLRKEVLEALKHVHFHFEKYSGMHFFFIHIGILFRTLRYLEIGAGSSRTDLLKIFGIEMRGRRSGGIYKYELVPEYLDTFLLWLADEPGLLRLLRINIPAANKKRSGHACQRNFNNALWVGVRGLSRRAVVLELRGFISTAQQKEFSDRHAMERTQAIIDDDEWKQWQKRELSKCSETRCTCEPACCELQPRW